MKLRDKLIMFLITENFRDVSNPVCSNVYNYYLSTRSKIVVFIFEKVVILKVISYGQAIMSKDIIITCRVTDICSKIMELVNICKYFGF